MSDQTRLMAEGHRLGVYQVQALLGAGGMGEVYRARDTKLERDVAIKVVRSAFTSDPDRLARFEREARMLAALNHPNIGAIYGLEEAEGIRFRTDIWAFGCVLYETLTGQVAFKGDTMSDTIVAVLGSEPEWDALPNGTPAVFTKTDLQRNLFRIPLH
jgi:serine/threonine protein kinase